MNSRPLTYQESAEGQTTITTPNIFIRPNKSPGLLLQLGRNYLSSLLPPSRRKLIDTIELSRFRELWCKEYLLNIRGRSPGKSRILFQNRNQRNYIVLVKSPRKPRPFWMLGTILAVFPGQDGVVRTTRDKQGDGLVKFHSLKNLYPMEISQSDDDPDESEFNHAGASSPSASGSIQLSGSSQEGDDIMCPTSNKSPGSQDRICCDSCDE